MTDRTNADAERVSDIVARLRRVPNRPAGGPVAIGALMTEAADIIEAQSKALAEAREANRRLIRNIPFIIEDHVCGGSDTRPVVDVDGLVGALTENIDVLTPTPENPNG